MFPGNILVLKPNTQQPRENTYKTLIINLKLWPKCPSLKNTKKHMQKKLNQHPARTELLCTRQHQVRPDNHWSVKQVQNLWRHHACLEATSVPASATVHWIQAGSLTDNCQLTKTIGRRWLRSSNIATCEIPRTRTSLGDRLFTVAGPHLWNNVPLHLRDSEHTPDAYRVPPVTEDAYVLLRTAAPNDGCSLSTL